MSEDSTRNTPADGEQPDAESDRILERLEKKGAKALCPMCNVDAWWSLLPPGFAPSISISHDEDLTTYALICANCGFVRQHAADIVEEEASKHPVLRKANTP